MDWESTIHEIVEVLQNKVKGFNVSEVVKGGSLGQGTAVPGKADLDLVLYSRDINPDSVKRNGVNRYINELDVVLKTEFGVKYQIDKKTPFALQFTLRTSLGALEVDLLPSPYWSSANEYIVYMSRLSQLQRRKFQCSEAKWIKEFFQKQPDALKEYIRRAKVWRDRMWPKGVAHLGKPKSFLLSLLIVEAYYRVRMNNDPVALTRKVKRMVRRHKRLRVHWVGRGAEYRRCGRYIRQHERLGEPYILDPVNPFNNVYISGILPYRPSEHKEDTYREGNGNWTNMVRYIESLDLTRPIYS